MVERRTIRAIVEGPGEVDAVPELLRRILGKLHCRYDVVVPPARATKNRSTLLNKLSNFLEYAIVDGCEGILVLVDTDRDYCPRNLAHMLARTAVERNLNVPVAIVCANSEYETWFICTLSDSAGQGIRDRLGISAAVTAPENVERIRGAKEWLEDRMPRDSGYRPTSHQAALTHHIDIDLVQSRSRSFRRLCHAVDELIDAMDRGTSAVTPAPDCGV